MGRLLKPSDSFRLKHDFFIKKWREGEAEPYFDGWVGRNIVVAKGNLFILSAMMDSFPYGPALTTGNTYIGVSDNEEEPLRTDTGLGGDNLLYKAMASGSYPLLDTDDGTLTCRGIFVSGTAEWLWASVAVCTYTGGSPPTDDTGSSCSVIGRALLDEPDTKATGEIWELRDVMAFF